MADLTKIFEIEDGVGIADSTSDSNNATEMTITREGDDMTFTDPTAGTETLSTLKEGANFGIAGRYALTLIYNGTLSNGTFIGYLNTVNGLDTPIIIPRDSTLKDLTFSNRISGADYTLYLRKNSPTATPFETITKTNTKTFTHLDIDEVFAEGDTIYIEYQDDGQNANDASIVLFLRNN